MSEVEIIRGLSRSLSAADQQARQLRDPQAILDHLAKCQEALADMLSETPIMFVRPARRSDET